MTITINDPVLLAQLKATSGSVELRGPDGDFLGAFQTPFGKPPPGYVPPITDEEMKRRRMTYRDGKPLAEILARLEGGTK